MTEQFTRDADIRYAIAPNPEPVEGILYRVHVLFEELDGRLWSTGIRSDGGCQGRRETRPKFGAKHCHRGLRGEMVRGGRDEAGGGVSRKRREGVARAQFPAGGDAQIRSSSPCYARGCG